MQAFFQLIVLSVSSIFHPFYISMTEMNYNQRDKQIEISVRIFTNDFEKTLRKNCHCKIDLQEGKEKKAMETQVNAYILRHLQIKIDGQPENPVFSGFQQEEESTWSYFVIKNIAQVKKMEIDNSLLYDYTNEQINMLHVKANGKEQTDKLDFPQKIYSINY